MQALAARLKELNFGASFLDQKNPSQLVLIPENLLHLTLL
jgi:hypothetical protein